MLHTSARGCHLPCSALAPVPISSFAASQLQLLRSPRSGAARPDEGAPSRHEAGPLQWAPMLRAAYRARCMAK